METKERACANDLGLSRRALMAALPFAALASPVPAAAPSPVMVMFREWRAHHAWLNGPESADCPEEQFNGLCAANVRMIERMVEEPCRDMADLCLKLLALTDFGQFVQFPELATLDQLRADVRAAIDGA